MIDKILFVFKWVNFIFDNLFAKEFSFMNFRRKRIAYVLLVLLFFAIISVYLNLPKGSVFLLVISFSLKLSLFFISIFSFLYHPANKTISRYFLQSHQNIKELLNDFSHYSFFFTVTFFSYFLSFIIQFFILSKSYDKLFLYISPISSFFWMAYHVFTNPSFYTKIRSYVRDYILIFGIIALIFDEKFFTIYSIALSLVLRLIEKVEMRQEKYND